MIPRVIVLDTGPLSDCVVLPAHPGKAPTRSQQCRQWLRDCEQNNAILIVPAIAYYEALRELERRQAAAKIQRLKSFTFLLPDRFVPLTTRHQEDAASMWGSARNAGMPTASSEAIDGDVILAAQAISLGLSTSDYIIATTNPGHIARFAPCNHWTSIKP